MKIRHFCFICLFVLIIKRLIVMRKENREMCKKLTVLFGESRPKLAAGHYCLKHLGETKGENYCTRMLLLTS